MAQKRIQYDRRKVRELRKKQNVSRYLFGKPFKTCTSQVKAWEQGTTMPSIQKIVEMCNVYGLEPNDFFIVRGSEDEKEETTV